VRFYNPEVSSRLRIVSIVGIVSVLVAGAALTAWLVIARRPPAPAPPGIPLALAEERAARVSDLRVTLSLAIPQVRSEPVRGRVVASFALADAKAPLYFDFAQPADRLLKVTVNGRVIEAPHANGHVAIPARRLESGANRVEFEFIAGDESLNRSEEFMYTLFVPARASLAFPCFDQPNLKARWTIDVDVPAGWTALSNGAETRLEEREGRMKVSFAETQPLPTYLVAVAAGRFQVETAARNGRTFRMLHRETDPAKVARNREAIFDLHASALAWLHDYTGTAYPFGKFDFILLPAFQFSGMEHPGAIYYNAPALLLDESATQNQFLNRANTISHETAHMWFGDLVTMRWFNDVWMKEVFASFMAARIVNPSFPEVHHDLRFLLQNYPPAYDVDRTEGANPIRQELANLNEAGSLYGAIIYQKAPIAMRQLELQMGAAAFRDGLREYLGKYAFGNAAWPDLIAILDNRTPADLGAWSRAWIDEPGRPLLRVTPLFAGRRIDRLTLSQEDPRGRSIQWPQRVQVRLGDSLVVPVSLAGAETDVPAAAGVGTRWVLPLDGYGLLDLDPTSLDFVSRRIGTMADPYARGAAAIATWEAMLEGKVASGRVLDVLLLALSRETNELLVQQMLDYVRVAFWRFTAADDRPAVAARVEAALRAGLARAGSTSLKAAWFDAFRRVATESDSIAWLAQVWRGDTTIPGLPLSETDEADLAADLAVRDVPDAAAILSEQLERFKNADRKARFTFLLPALSSDPATRDQFFESLKSVDNRRREAWVLDAVRYLHHPLRAGNSRKHVRAALELTLEIQQTGDIFFPKRWVDATLSGYQTLQTAAEVRGFIDSLPASYPARLKWVLLASADPLFRAARLQNQ
jgi:aminopeptidase N